VGRGCAAQELNRSAVRTATARSAKPCRAREFDPRTDAALEICLGRGWRLRKAYAEAYAEYFPTYLPGNGVPTRFTVHVVDVPDTTASNEFDGTALLQRSLQGQDQG
jgi:hypothetical protein